MTNSGSLLAQQDGEVAAQADVGSSSVVALEQHAAQDGAGCGLPCEEASTLTPMLKLAMMLFISVGAAFSLHPDAHVGLSAAGQRAALAEQRVVDDPAERNRARRSAVADRR